MLVACSVNHLTESLDLIVACWHGPETLPSFIRAVLKYRWQLRLGWGRVQVGRDWKPQDAARSTLDDTNSDCSTGLGYERLTEQ